MKKRHLFNIISGLLIFLGGIMLRASNSINDFGFNVMMAAGITIFMVSIIRHKRYGDGVEKDERTLKVSYTALAASFQITLMIMLILWWIDYFNPIQLAINQLLALIILIMIFLNIVFRFYYSKKDNLML
jgi:uncharacterized membrane protein